MPFSKHLAVALTLAGILSSYHYLLAHTLLEMFCVITAFSVMIIACNTYETTKNHFFIFLGITGSIVGFFDFLHAFTYKGMSMINDGGANIPTQLWIAARYLESSALLAAPFFFTRSLQPRLVAYIYTALGGLILLTVFYWRTFPECYIEGSGLTSFKITSEYLIATIYVAALAVLRQLGRSHLDMYVIKLLTVAIIAKTLAELSFTVYIDVYGATNFIGHVLKVISTYYIYVAFVEISLKEPHKILYFQLEQTKDKLQASNQQLQTEIGVRMNAQHELEASLKELRLTQKALWHREKLAAMGQMAAGMAHEVKNPLTSVRGFAQLLTRKCANDAKTSQYAATIVSEVDQACGVIDNFLQLARPNPPALQEYQLNQLVREVLMMVDPQAFLQHISIDFSGDDSLDTCRLDPGQMKQALINICQNAIEAMPGGGKLTIHTGLRDRDQYVSITDTGNGIPEELLTKIGVPFFTTKDTGTGLGLSISYSLIDAHKGRVEIDSSIGIGTTFKIYLPCAA